MDERYSVANLKFMVKEENKYGRYVAREIDKGI